LNCHKKKINLVKAEFLTLHIISMKIYMALMLIYYAMFLFQMDTCYGCTDCQNKFKEIIPRKKLTLPEPTKRRKLKQHLCINILQYLDLPSVSTQLQKILPKYPTLAREFREFVFPVLFTGHFSLKDAFQIKYRVTFDQYILLLNATVKYIPDTYPSLKAIFQPPDRNADHISMTLLSDQHLSDEYPAVHVFDTRGVKTDIMKYSMTYHYRLNTITSPFGETRVERGYLPQFLIFTFIDPNVPPQMKTVNDFEILMYGIDLDENKFWIECLCHFQDFVLYIQYSRVADRVDEFKIFTGTQVEEFEYRDRYFPGEILNDKSKTCGIFKYFFITKNEYYGPSQLCNPVRKNLMDRNKTVGAAFDIEGFKLAGKKKSSSFQFFKKPNFGLGYNIYAYFL